MRNEFNDNANFPCANTNITAYNKSEKAAGANYV
jgi:hypothetical protein